MSKLYANITNVTYPISVNVNHSHGSAVSIATINCANHSLNIGDSIDVDIGYPTDHARVFRGYVKQIERKVPDDTYTITAHDVLVRAVDYFVVSSNPENPFTRSNISAEDLVRDVLAEASLTNYDYDATFFTFAPSSDVEVNLVSAYDFCKQIADLLTWHLYADQNGQVHFVQRKPNVMVAGSPEEDQPGFTVDIPFATITNSQILNISHKKSEKDLRNRMVVYGSTGVYASAQSANSYDPDTGTSYAVLPGGYFKSSVLATAMITTNSMAQTTADYNLQLYNKLSSELFMTVVGDSNYLARRVVTIVQPDLGLNGDYYIYSSEHSWGKDGYTVNLILRK